MINVRFELSLRNIILWSLCIVFLRTNLKHVQRPLLQEPFCPPRPQAPAVTVPESQFEQQLMALFDNALFADCILIVSGQEIACHRVVLTAASPAFAKLFSRDLIRATLKEDNLMTSSASSAVGPQQLVRSASDSSIASSVDNNSVIQLDTDYLLNKRNASTNNFSRINSLKRAYQKTAALLSSVATPISTVSCIAKQHHQQQRQQDVNGSDSTRRQPRMGDVNLNRRASLSWQNLADSMSAFNSSGSFSRPLQHQLFDSITVSVQPDNRILTTVTLKSVACFTAVERCIQFMYTGK